MQDTNKTLRVAITHGDTNGIGYELILRVFSEPEILEMFTPIVYGSANVAAQHAEAMEINCRYNVIKDARDAAEGRLNILSAIEFDVKVEFGKPTMDSSNASRQALNRALRDYSEGLFDVLVMAPTAEDDTHVIVDMLGSIVSGDKNKNLMPMNILVDENVNMSSVAGNVPLDQVAKYVSEEDVVERATLLRDTLRRDLRVDNPYIAILAQSNEFDPSDSESVENKVIAPAIAKLAAAGVQAFGPYSVMDFFDKIMWQRFDAVLAMHDGQYVEFYDHLFDSNGVMLHAGMPIVVTSPCVGPSFEVAGKGICSEISMRNAIYTAIDVLRNRLLYDEPLKNPLPKMYHERKEDGDRSRFTVKKKEGEFDKHAPKTESAN